MLGKRQKPEEIEENPVTAVDFIAVEDIVVKKA